MRSIKVLALGLAVALPLVMSQASAAVIYSFTQTGPTIATGAQYGPDGPNDVLTVGTFTLSDAILGAPFSLSASNNRLPPGSPTPPPPAGLLDIFFATIDRGVALIGDLPRFLRPNPHPANGQDYRFSLTGGPGTLFPAGIVAYNDSESNTDLVFAADGRVTGTYSTDRGGPCFTSEACTFTGRLAAARVPDAQAIPEPVSLALFGMGLAALSVVRRRRRPAGQTGSGQMKRWRSR